MTNILNSKSINDPQSILDEIEGLEEAFDFSEDPLGEARNFLYSFVNEINFKYGMNLTLDDAFYLARMNICSMQISEEQKSSMLQALQLLELGPFEEIDSSIGERSDIYSNLSGQISWLWSSKWFGLNKNKKLVKKMGLYTNPQEDIDLPSSVYIGAIELFVAPLIFILPFPGAQAFAVGVAADGLRRIAEGVEQLGEERRNDPSYSSPKPPFNN